MRWIDLGTYVLRRGSVQEPALHRHSASKWQSINWLLSDSETYPSVLKAACLLGSSFQVPGSLLTFARGSIPDTCDMECQVSYLKEAT